MMFARIPMIHVCSFAHLLSLLITLFALSEILGLRPVERRIFLTERLFYSVLFCSVARSVITHDSPESVVCACLFPVFHFTILSGAFELKPMVTQAG